MENRPAPLRSRRVCRFCLTEAEPLSFIYDRELSRPFQVPLSLQIMSCVSIEVYSADGMPQMICQMCRWNLDRCYKFKQQCKKADEALRAYPMSGVLPRPFPPITNDPPEQSNKRTLESRSTNEQAKKARLDNGDRERREVQEYASQRQSETRAQAQQREKEERRDLYDEDQEAGSEAENEVNDAKDDTKLEPGEIRVHACNQCERTFPLLQSLQLHMQRAHRDRNYRCTECERPFFSKSDLQKHMTTHSEDKPYSCQICQKQFSRANLLQRHEKVHREELRYRCPHCDREFFTSEDLESHEEAVHKAIKPYQCNICNKRFTYKQGLERHEMLHSEDKTFVCEYCKEAFRSSTKLARHLTTHAGHRPYVCKLCPRTFLLSHHLTRHMRTHSVEKRHQCEDCGKAFKRRESLEVHQLTHAKRSGMGLTCDVCQESCRNRADYVTHIKQHVDAGEKMGPDGLPPDNKEKILETETEEEEEEEEQYSDDDYEPPSSYLYKKAQQKMSKKVESEEEPLEKEDKKEQVVYVRSKDGNVLKKTIKTLMPIQRRGEQQPPQETKSKPTVASPQIITAKQLKQDEVPSVQTPQKDRMDETEAQVQKIVASVFKEHKIPRKHQGQETNKETQPIQRQASQVLTPTIIKEEKLDTPIASISSQKNVNTVKVIKRIVVRKPAGSADGVQTISTPIKELVQMATNTHQQQQAAAATASTSGPKVTKRVIVRRIIRQGDTTREVIMNPDGTIIDPAELAKLPTGNVVKRVVVKKPLDKGQNIEQMLQSADANRIIRMAECENIANILTAPKMVTQVQRVEQPQPQQKQVVINDDRETKEKLEQLEKRVEQQRLKIEELQARKQQQEYEACDEMLPDRHDESEDEQQLPLKRVFVKRKQSIYDEEKEYIDEKDKEEDEQADACASEVSPKMPKEEELSQASVTFEEKIDDKPMSPSRSIEDAKIIIIKPEENPPDVDEMSRELCSILDSTDSVVKMQENVLNNLTQITSVGEMSSQKAMPILETEGETTEQIAEELEVPASAMTHEEPMEQEEVITGDDIVEQSEEQVQEEEVSEQQDPSLHIVITQSEDEGIKLQYENSQEDVSQVEATEEIAVERIERTQSVSTLSPQVLSETNDMFETSVTSMEADVDKSQDQANLDESVIEMSATSETINLNETTDSRDSLEDKLSQMEG